MTFKYKFFGKMSRFIEILESLKLQVGGSVSISPTNGYRFILEIPSNGYITWWPSTGTVFIQGSEKAKEEIAEKFQSVLDMVPIE